MCNRVLLASLVEEIEQIDSKSNKLFKSEHGWCGWNGWLRRDRDCRRGMADEAMPLCGLGPAENGREMETENSMAESTSTRKEN